MTPDQFKAWFEGFCEGISDAPTPEQWAKIKAKIGELRAAVPAPSRPPEWNRQWGQNGPPTLNPVVGTPFSHETRVIGADGRDLGPSD